ncbi:hypothetical protein AAF712_010883 [Marasmius tenuissimus]|uniref:CxC2-like cysteine cluster KDZ transposase-associated domain-containing protein n=1 Tax=Marasmius tenuissimus TaxID=585030 RepID=A0ABR2ZNE2_9AGAR
MTKRQNAFQSTGSRLRRSTVKVADQGPSQSFNDDLIPSLPGEWVWDDADNGGGPLVEDFKELEEEPGQVKVQPKKKKCYEDSDAPLIAWKGEHRNEYLDVHGFNTYKDPRSAATFNLLHNFQIINLQAQAPPMDFLKALEQITDGSGLRPVLDREAQFLLMLRQWRHIKMAKRCGRCHNPTSVEGTSYGEAAVQCCACPHPGRNLPEDWAKVPKEDSFLHALFLSQDANFKQKARARKNDHRDLALGDGWGTFVPNKEYMEELAKRTDKVEISHCVGFHAMATTNTKKSKGLRATGVAAVSCACHETFRPNGMGDLQVGERQSNMDFLALFSLIGSAMLLVFLSYDIACQWMQNFRTRMSTYPQHMRLPSWMNVIFKVPKFHLPVHILKCHSPFAFGYTEGAAKTDGEGPERLWSWLNAGARPMSMMSTGGCWDTMDDFTGFWNYQKVIESSLVSRLVKAIPEAIVTARAFSAFTDALKDDHVEDLAAWQKSVEEWEQGQSRFCPYDVSEPTISMTKIRKDLAEEEHKRELAGQNTPSSTAARMIIKGIEIEEAQRAFVATATKQKLTDFRKETLAKSRTKLVQRILRYRQLLLHHLPFLRQTLEADPITSDSVPETLKLFLPSSLDSELRKLCPPDVMDIERRLCYGQAYDSLARLRAQLGARAVAFKRQSRVLPSQGNYTTTRALQDQIEVKVTASKLTYQSARNALMVLVGPGEWTERLRELKDDDIRGITERLLKDNEKEELRRAQELAGYTVKEINEVLDAGNVPTAPLKRGVTLGQSSLSLSWIWYTHMPLSQWWSSQINHRPDVPAWLAEGLTAYAKEHCEVEKERALMWSTSWAGVRERAKTVLRCLMDPEGEPTLQKLSELIIEVEMDEEEEQNVDIDNDNPFD